jgi:Protein of unknown function (DUF2585)
MADATGGSPGQNREAPTRVRSPAWTCVLIAAGLLVLLALVLLLMGRPPWCKCGYIKLWHGDVISSENSQHIADWYTFTHIIHGFGLYGILWLIGRRWSLELRFLLALLIEVAWGIFENTDFVITRYREDTLALGYYGDSVINAAADVLACVSGFVLAARLPVWATVALAVVIEGGLAFVIRDNLTLNIIMLVYPFAAIKEWQLGAFERGP